MAWACDGRRVPGRGVSPGLARLARGRLPCVGARVVAGQAGLVGRGRGGGDLALGGRGGNGGGGEAFELGAELPGPAAENEAADEMGGDEGEQALQAGEQQGGRFAGLLAVGSPGGWWGSVHRVSVNINDMACQGTFPAGSRTHSSMPSQ